MDRHQDGIILREKVHPAAALCERNILHLRNQQPGVVAFGLQDIADHLRNLAGPGVFQEEAIGAALAGSPDAVPVVNQDLHSEASSWE